MIFYLRGKIVHTEHDYTVIDVNGTAYQVFCSNPYVFSVKDEDVTIYTYQHVREDAILLYGFPTMEEQRMFKRLLDVSGIGPRVALGLLSGARPEQIVSAIQTENIAFLTKLPGVGKKTAQRMILDLKDKLSDMEGFSISQLDGLQEAAASSLDDSDDIWSEAKEGLKALGYTEAEADGALKKVRAKAEGELSVDELMRQSLQSLFRP